MSQALPGAELRRGPRFAALSAVLWLLACSGAESGSNDAASGGSLAGGGSGSIAGGAGGFAPTGGSGARAGAATGGVGPGGASGGVLATGGATSAGGRAGGSALSGGASGSAGAPPSGGLGGRATGGTGGSLDAAGGGSGGSGGLTGGRGGGGGKAGGGGVSGSAGATAGGSGGASSGCPFQGSITYSLARAASPTAAQTAAYDKITTALDKALGYYNCYTDISKELRVSYEPSVATADGNVNGSIRFGSQDSMNHITAMHEIGHTLGVGSNEWGRLLRDGIFTGETATAKLREIDDDPTAQVHGDAQHFWPYGLNYTSEVKSEADLLAHCALVMAIRADIYP